MKLENLNQPPLNTTMMGVLRGVLDYYQIEMSDAMAYGGSGHAFLINVHEKLCPSGPYCWKYDRFYELVRNLGVEMTDLGFFHKGSTQDQRAAVEQQLKEALDKKLPCSLCNMENQLISGYDGEKFFTAQPWPKVLDFPPATLTFGTWKELKDEVHVNFFVFRKLAKKDDDAITRESLRYAIDLFRNPDKYNLRLYGIGPKAYDNWAKAVKEHGSSHGNWWNATVWSECRARASDYFSEIAARHEGDVSSSAQELSKAYKEIADLLARIADKKMDAGKKAPIIEDLKGREQRAIQKIEEFAALLG